MVRSVIAADRRMDEASAPLREYGARVDVVDATVDTGASTACSVQSAGAT